MANMCKCGCGEFLPEGSNREFKRGHKARLENPDTVFSDQSDMDENSTAVPFTIDDAARDTPDDPEPKDQPEYKPKTQVRLTSAIRKDIEGKLALFFAVSGESWSMVDPLCGQVLVDNGPNMAKKYTPLLCQSPEVVKWMTKRGNFILWIDALVATGPLLKMAAAHHIMRTVTVEAMYAGANGQGPVVNEYVVQ
jgi:hypothetical protein